MKEAIIQYNDTPSGGHLAISWKPLVRCKDCVKKGNSYLCRFDRDLEEYGSHRTEADDDWFCADGERSDT